MTTGHEVEGSAMGTARRRAHVLLVMDNRADATLVRRKLRRAAKSWLFEVTEAPTLAAATERLAHARIDAILLDPAALGASWRERIRRVRDATPSTPVILFTTSEDEKLAIEAVGEEAQDYLVKWDFSRESLARAIGNAVRRERAEHRLREARTSAENASRAKSTFLANMSHEIRGPMNIMLGMAELLRAASMSPRQREQLERLERAADHLMALIDNVLDLSRIEAGRLDLERAPLDVEEIVVTTREMVQAAADAKGLELRVELRPTVPHLVLGDPKRIRQVLLNLLLNAVKFTERGYIEIGVESDRAGQGAVPLHFWVTDTGVGIPPEKLGHIFTQFGQGDPSIARRHGGSGLGLGISSGLVERMGGALRVESRVGRGSTFHVNVSLDTTSGIAAREPEVVPDMPTVYRSLRARRTPIRILFVDDSRDNHVLLEAFVADLRVVLRTADCGQEALQLFANEAFEWVIVDRHLPQMDGLETVRAMRELERSTTVGRTPILGFSADVLTESIAHATAAGCDGYLAKPVRRSTLLEAIWRHAGCATDARLDAIPAEVRRIVPRYISHRRLDLEKMRSALAAADYETILALAHNLKGSGGAYGFPDLTKVGTKIERAAAERDPARAALELNGLERALVSAQASLAQCEEAKHG